MTTTKEELKNELDEAKAELQKTKEQLANLTGRFNEMMGAFASLAKRIDQNLSFIQKSQQELNGMKVDIATLKTGGTPTPKMYDTSVKPY